MSKGKFEFGTQAVCQSPNCQETRLQSRKSIEKGTVLLSQTLKELKKEMTGAVTSVSQKMTPMKQDMVYISSADRIGVHE